MVGELEPSGDVYTIRYTNNLQKFTIIKINKSIIDHYLDESYDISIIEYIAHLYIIHEHNDNIIQSTEYTIFRKHCTSRLRWRCCISSSLSSTQLESSDNLVLVVISVRTSKRYWQNYRIHSTWHSN